MFLGAVQRASCIIYRAVQPEPALTLLSPGGGGSEPLPVARCRWLEQGSGFSPDGSGGPAAVSGPAAPWCGTWKGGLGLGSALCSPPELHPPLWCCAGGARGGLTVSSVRAPSSRAKFLTFGPLGGGWVVGRRRDVLCSSPVLPPPPPHHENSPSKTLYPPARSLAPFALPIGAGWGVGAPT